jgi:hypothetical protein
MALTPTGGGLWVLDHMGNIRSYGAAPVFSTPPEPVRPAPFVALAATPTGGGLYLLTMHGHLRTLGDAKSFIPR